MPLADKDVPKPPKSVSPPPPPTAGMPAQVAANIKRTETQTVYAAPPPDMNAIIPATGETLRTHLLRRMNLVVNKNPEVALKDVLALSSLGITDQELESIAQFHRIVTREGEAIVDPRLGQTKKVRGSRKWFGLVGGDVREQLVVPLTEEELALRGDVDIEQLKKRIEEGGGLGIDTTSAADPFLKLGELINKPIERVTRPVLGPIAQSVGYVGQLIGSAAQDVAAYIDPTNAIPHTDLPKAPSPQEMWRNAMSMTVGEQFAAGANLKRGSKEATIAAATADFMVQWKLGGYGGKFAKGLEAAKTLPLAPGGVAPNGMKGLTKFAYELKAKPVEQLVRDTKYGKKMVDEVYAVSREGNANRLLERYPQLHPDTAEELILAPTREAAEDVFVSAMKGEIMPAARATKLARIGEINDEATRMVEAGTADGERVTALLRERTALETGLSQAAGKTVVRELPHSTFKTNFMDIVKRGPLIPGEKRTAFQWAAKALDKNWTRRFWTRLPHYGINIVEKESGRAQIGQWGELLKYGRTEIDDFSNRYLASTSKGEVQELFRDMLAGAEHRLPPGIARSTLQMVDNPLGFEYAVDDIGRGVNWSYKVKSAPDRLAREYPQPLMSSQLSDIIPTPDPRAVLEATLLRSRLRDALYRAGRSGGVKGAAAKAGAAGTDAYIKTQHAVGLLTSMVWKPMVLARIGWPVKVVMLDEQARLAANDIPSFWNKPWEHYDDVKLAIKDIASGKTPDEVLMHAGRALVTRKPANRVLAFGNKGFGQAYQSELILMAKADEVAYMARHGKEKTKEWLLSNPRGQKILSDYQPVLDRMEKSVDDWLDTLETQIATKARTKEIKDALATGRIKIGESTYNLGDKDVAEHFQLGVFAEDVPQAVRDTGDVWARWDNKTVRKFVDGVMNNLGSKPTNYLSRGPAFKAFYNREYNYLVSRGISRNLAAAEAKQWATRQTNDLLYNLMSKTQFDVLHENLVPFMPAWKEVLKTWTVNVPNAIGGPVIGQLTMLQRINLLGDLGKEIGILKEHKDQDGKKEWILDLGIYKTPLTRLAMFGTLPGLGPLHSAALSELGKRSKTVEKLIQPFFQYGPEVSLGPAWINRLIVATTGKAPPWEITSSQFQQDQFDMTVLRQMQLKAKDIRRIAAMPEGDEKKAAAQQLVEDAKRSAMNEYLVRVATGFFLPAAPLREDENSKKLDDFRESLKSLTTGERRNAYEDFVSENPNLEFMLTSRSYRTPGAPEAEKGRDAYWRDKRKGWIKTYDPQTFAHVLIGFAEYDRARFIANEKIAKAGSTARERLLNIGDVLEANLEKRATQYDLERTNKAWAEAFHRVIDDKGPVLDVAQQKVLDAHRMLGLLQVALKGQEEDVDWKAVRTVKAQLGEIVRDYNIFTDSNDMAAGVDKTYARYFDNIFGSYMDGLDSIYSKLDNARTSEEVSAVMEEARQYRNSQTEQTLDGEQMPRPEEVLYRMKSDDDRTVTKQGWAMTPTEWLTNFQRETVGYGEVDKATEYWDAVNKERLNLRQWQSDNRISPSSRQYRDRKAALDAWERNVAINNGLSEEYNISKALPFQRLAHFNLVDETVTWPAVQQTAQEIQRQMQAREMKSFNNEAGRYYAGLFMPWIDGLRQQNEEFGTLLEKLRAVAPKKVQSGPWDNFYAYLFLTGKTFGVN